jgi:hypothetical protein
MEKKLLVITIEHTTGGDDNDNDGNNKKSKNNYCKSYGQAPDFADMSSFSWYVTDNVREYAQIFNDFLHIEMYILHIILGIFCHFEILVFFVFV